MIEFFKSRGCVVKIVCFVRSPIGYVNSVLQEHIRGGVKAISYINPHYKLRLREFSLLLPEENLIVRDFAEIMNEYGDVVSGFASICGLEKDRIKSIRMNESLSKTATRLVYRLNKLPHAISGTQDRFLATQKLISILAIAFPVSSDDKLDVDILSGLLNPDLDNEMKFILEKFQIDFDKVPHSPNLEACETYLSDLSSFNLQHLANVLKGHKIQTSHIDSIDDMLIALYISCHQKVQKRSKYTYKNALRVFSKAMYRGKI